MQDKIVFFNDGHSYFYKNRKIPSVSAEVKKIVGEFDSVYWGKHGALKLFVGDAYLEHYRSFDKFSPPDIELFDPFMDILHTKEFLEVYRELMGGRERHRLETAFRGTAFHSKMEAQAYKDGGAFNPYTGEFVKIPMMALLPKEFDNETLTMDLSQLENGFYPELLIFDLKWNLVGQSDQVFIYTEFAKKFFDIGDFKTNEKKPSKSAPTRCNAPFMGEYASKHFAYTLQLNTYAAMLVRHGLTPGKMGYTHYKNYDPDTADVVEVDNIIDKVTSYLDNR